MQLFGFYCLVAALITTILMGLAGAWAAFSGQDKGLAWVERGQNLVLLLLLAASAVLTRALVARDFSFQYVMSYTDTYLPMFYTVTAFWAGQAGSFLFWAVCVVFLVWIFAGTRTYRELSPSTKAVFWLLHSAVVVFFLVVLTGPTNPFMALSPAPAQGNGLNPLLRNPGMIFHPPLLFIGYAAFTVPACLGLASWLTGEKRDWLVAGRNWTLVAWMFLTAGIVLGAWWAYMELGWGGYWAWDPVENASLIPWFSATAFLHTAVIQSRRNALHKTNVFFVGLNLILAFFATYLVRSGVIDSLHAFGKGGVGGILLVFMLAGLGVSIGIALLGRKEDARPLDEFMSRQGLLLTAAWLFLALGAVVFLGTMWPVISNIWSQSPKGLDAGFYNRVCLPLFALVSLFLVFCPWLGWKGGLRNRSMFFAVAASLIPAGVFFWIVGVRDPLPLVAASSAVSAMAGIAALFATDSFVRRTRTMWGAYGVHLGLALMVLGVAFSGPYKQDAEAVLAPGASVRVGQYVMTYTGSHEEADEALARFIATLEVSRDGKPVGTLVPERHMYRGFNQPFAEVSIIPSFGDELYATVLGHDKDGKASFKISVNPLVNWVWIGGTLMSLFPLLALGRRR